MGGKWRAEERWLYCWFWGVGRGLIIFQRTFWRSAAAVRFWSFKNESPPGKGDELIAFEGDQRDKNEIQHAVSMIKSS